MAALLGEVPLFAIRCSLFARTVTLPEPLLENCHPERSEAGAPTSAAVALGGVMERSRGICGPLLVEVIEYLLHLMTQSQRFTSKPALSRADIGEKRIAKGGFQNSVSCPLRSVRGFFFPK
jgi:hypothetical protein